MTTHTPGPWYVSSGDMVASESTGETVATVKNPADATILAASLAMLKALKDALEEFEYLAEHTSIKTDKGDYIDPDPTVETTMRAAIRKAKGE